MIARKTNPLAARFDPADEGLDLPTAQEIRAATGKAPEYTYRVTYEVTVAVPDSGPLTLGILRALLAHPDITCLPDTYTAGLSRPPAPYDTGHALRVTSQRGTPLTDETPIEELDFTVRTFNCLKRENVHTVGALRHVRLSSLRQIRNFNDRSIEEVINTLGKAGLSLMPEPEELDLLLAPQSSPT